MTMHSCGSGIGEELGGGQRLSLRHAEMCGPVIKDETLFINTSIPWSVIMTRLPYM